MLKGNADRNSSLNNKLRYIILSMLFPLVMFIIALLFLLGFNSVRYSKITHNVSVGSEFSIDFKENIDLKMYHYAVGSSQQKEVPIDDVEAAINLAKSLKRTTYQNESRQAIQNVIDYCENLEERIYSIEETVNYDSRMTQLDNNIYVLTNLIQDKMMDYIYYEARYMATIEGTMVRDIKVVIVIAVILVTGAITLLLYRTLRFTRNITKPISELCENVRQVGHGEFEIPEIKTNDYEIEQLNAGILKMAKRITKLVDNVKVEEKLQHKTQLQLLQAQISPHFLYNTLDTIIWLVESDKNDQAIEMLGNLSIFFRTTLSKGNDIISLEDEIMHTRSYLEIQQSRYRDIMDYSIQLPKNLKNIRVPKLMIQPLAENALYHGVKEKRGKSQILIKCEKETNGEIVITVMDNGIGMKPERLEEMRRIINGTEKDGFGIAAVNDRIKLYFGEEYGISIESEYGKGTVVKARLSEKMEQI